MNEQEELAKYVSRLATDVNFFCDELWVAIGLPPLADHQKQILDWLQHGPKRRGVKAFRGAAKTFLTLGYAAWRLFNDPDERVLILSKSERHAKDSLHMLRKWIGSVPWLQHMTPDARDGQRDSAIKFDIKGSAHDRTASVTAMGCQSQVTGCRASIVICDDPESPVNTLTQELRHRLREDLKELDNVLIPGGDVIYLGTPHQPRGESVYDKLAEGGYKFYSWPARFPEDDERSGDLAPGVIQAIDNDPSIKGASVWPSRFNDDELLAREASEGRSHWMMQYMLKTDLGDGLQYPLRLRDFVCMPVGRDKAPLTVARGYTNDRGGSTRLQDIPCVGFADDGIFGPIMFDNDWQAYTGTKMWIDPSGRGKDSTGFAICSHLNGYLHIKDCGGLDGGFSLPTLETLCMRARDHRVNEIWIEANFGSDMLVSILQPVLRRFFIAPGVDQESPDGWGATLDSYRVSGQKELRIIKALEPPMNSGRLIIDPAVIANTELQAQITRLTRDRNSLAHDDEVESLAMVVKMWEEVLAVDPQANAERLRDRQQEDKIRQHYAAMGLATMGQPRWFNHS